MAIKANSQRAGPKPARRGRARRRLPRVLVVGFGRVGGALSLGLRRAGWPVSVLPRSAESLRRAATAPVPIADLEALRTAELCVLAVPDGAVTAAAELVEEDLSATVTLVHCAGALGLDAFGLAARRSTRTFGSFHPLVAISDPDDSLSGHAVAVAASRRPALATLREMAAALGLQPVEVPQGSRATYHAGAVMSAGLLVGLADAAVEALTVAGLNREVALSALLPLMQSALRGVERRGLSGSLTGPVVRGDVSVVQAHLEALPAELGAIYRLLSRRSLKLVANLPAETIRALERMLA